MWLNYIEAPVEQLAVAAAPEPRELTQTEQDKLHKQREAILRELRVFLRDLTNKLLAERKFKEFTKPVDPEEVIVTTSNLYITILFLNRYLIIMRL